MSVETRSDLNWEQVGSGFARCIFLARSKGQGESKEMLKRQKEIQRKDGDWFEICLFFDSNYHKPEKTEMLRKI